MLFFVFIFILLLIFVKLLVLHFVYEMCSTNKTWLIDPCFPWCVCVCVLRNKSARRSLAPPWQTWRSRLPLTTLSTRRSRRTTRSSASAPLAARWQEHPHSRSPAVGRLVLQAAHDVWFSHFAGRIHSPEKAVQHPDGELSRRRLSRPQLWNAICSLKI